jgi:uncharacterized protein (TIGR02996 family)
MTLDQLLSCLNQTPGDDVLWLALADRLEEEGQPQRAELVRLNRRLREMPEDDERWAAERRVRELIASGVVPCVPEVVNSIGMRFALIPAGTFWMGSHEDEADQRDDERLHRVQITRSFWLSIFPVTQAQYQAVMGGTPSEFCATGAGKKEVVGLETNQFPVECVSWDNAIEFCEWLSALPQEAASGRVHRLPSEAEWERACRGGLVSHQFHFGDVLKRSQAHFGGKLMRTCTVGLFPPNAYGVYDMHGNVDEWCSDWRGPYPDGPVADPKGPEAGVQRVRRGGAWGFPPTSCRSAARRGYGPAVRINHLGFRVVLAPPAT